MSSQDVVNEDVAELVGSEGFPSVIAALSLAASTYAAESDAKREPDPQMRELHRRLNDLANWTNDQGCF